MIQSVRHIAAMSPYALAKLEGHPGQRLISLAQNESLCPPSPRAVEAASRALAAGHLYPDPDWGDLRDALAALHGIPAQKILCGNGSMELIIGLAQAFADEHHAVLAPAHAYPFFKTAALLAGARIDTAAEETGQVSVDALLGAVRPDTRLVFVANPGNPTGSRIARSELLRLRNGLPDHVLLVIDEAYGEFADHLGEPMFDLVAHEATVILRTFSKAYGLAGLRVGWGFFPQAVATEMRKVMTPNSVSVASQAAAVAALDDQDYMLQTCAQTIGLRDAYISRLRAAGLVATESYTNFALVRFDNIEAAQRADDALKSEGIIARAQGGAGLPNCLRMTVGRAEDLDRAAECLERWAKGESP